MGTSPSTWNLNPMTWDWSYLNPASYDIWSVSNLGYGTLLLGFPAAIYYKVKGNSQNYAPGEIALASLTSTIPILVGICSGMPWIASVGFVPLIWFMMLDNGTKPTDARYPGKGFLERPLSNIEKAFSDAGATLKAKWNENSSTSRGQRSPEPAQRELAAAQTSPGGQSDLQDTGIQDGANEKKNEQSKGCFGFLYWDVGYMYPFRWVFVSVYHAILIVKDLVMAVKELVFWLLGLGTCGKLSSCGCSYVPDGSTGIAIGRVFQNIVQLIWEALGRPIRGTIWCFGSFCWNGCTGFCKKTPKPASRRRMTTVSVPIDNKTYPARRTHRGA